MTAAAAVRERTLTTLTLTSAERGLLMSALRYRQEFVARQRSITERDLAAIAPDDPHVEVLTRLAYLHETDLAVLDGLLAKVRAA